MKAMILAAGEGKRMRPLTLDCPKPLLKVGQLSLIEHQLRRLKTAGIDEVIINVAYRGQQIIDTLGDGADLGLRIRYSCEDEPLETGGALFKALPLLGAEPFLLVNGDVWCDVDLAHWVASPLAVGSLGRLLLVANPDHNPCGDFALEGDYICSRSSQTVGYTFSGMSLLRPQLIRDYPQARTIFPLKEALDAAMDAGRLEGRFYGGRWMDIGTPQRLEVLRALLAGEG